MWVTAGGRNSGKSFGGCLWLADYAMEHPGLRARIIAPTFADGVASCVEGPSGILRFAPSARFYASDPGGAKVKFPNGSTIWVIGTPTPRDVDRLRAVGNVHVDFFEEFAANPQGEAAFDQAELSRRAPGIPNRCVVATTPRPLKLLKEWAKTLGAAYVRVSSHANKYADKGWLVKLEAKLKGTRLYRQEVLGEILEDIEGALWTLADIERSQRPEDQVELVRYAIGVDPPSGAGTCGIIVVGADAENHVYPVADYSVTDATPNVWASRVVAAHEAYGGIIVAEINQGGKMVREVMKNVRADLPIKDVRAAVGKVARAEPIAVLWEAQEQIGHFLDGTLDDFAKLIDQMTGWVDGMGMPSPDEMDAMVWAVHHLRGTGHGEVRVAKPTGTLPGW